MMVVVVSVFYLSPQFIPHISKIPKSHGFPVLQGDDYPRVNFHGVSFSAGPGLTVQTYMTI